MSEEDMNMYIGLVHHPVVNKRGKEVTTSVTNLDIHDISRTAKTFGVKKYFIITPLLAQHELVGRILGHWESDTANAYNPDRQDALNIAEISSSIEDAEKRIESLEGQKPFLTITGANLKEYNNDYLSIFSKMKLDQRPCFLLFGTGWGLSATVINRAECCLPPIFGSNQTGYNHLSVRSAVAIYCDRLKRGL
jgi:hypothetical protein